MLLLPMTAICTAGVLRPTSFVIVMSLVMIAGIADISRCDVLIGLLGFWRRIGAHL